MIYSIHVLCVMTIALKQTSHTIDIDDFFLLKQTYTIDVDIYNN